MTAPPPNVLPDETAQADLRVRDNPATTALFWLVLFFFGLHTAGIDLSLIAHETADKPWTLVTSAFIHFELIHLLLNLFALWEVGRAIECLLGSRKYVALIVTSAAVSGTLQFMLDGAGIGFSGVVFALVGVLIASKTARQDNPVLCLEHAPFYIFGGVLMTLTHLPIAHAAHGSGLVFGVLVGWIVDRKPGGWAIPAFLASAGLLVCASFAGTPAERLLDRATVALHTLSSGQLGDARVDLDAFVAAHPSDGMWVSVALARAVDNDRPAANQAVDSMTNLALDEDMQRWVRDVISTHTTAMMASRRWQNAHTVFHIGTRLVPDAPHYWYNLGACEARLPGSRDVDVQAHLDRARTLNPSDPTLRANLGMPAETVAP